MMTICRLALSALFISLLASSGVARPIVKFTVDLRDTKSHSVHVTLEPTGFKGGNAIYQMPVWAPGAYSVTGYGRYVVNFKAADKNGYELPIEQLNENRWEIESGTAVQSIEYDVLDSHSDTTSLYFAMANIDTSLFFANATCLFGYYDDNKKAGAEVLYEIPSDWKLVCPLEPGQSEGSVIMPRFTAKNYDQLADAPILAAPKQKGERNTDYIASQSFTEGSANYDVAVVTDGTFSDAKMDSITEYLRKIVHAETDFFHDTPYKHYTFEIVAPTLSHMPSLAQGALEHSNSSDYLLANFGWSFFKRAYLSIFSHEFFHLWNVKRIHSKLLGPFDYTKRVMTTSLWMAEGITEYYAHTLLSRYGIIPPSEFYDNVSQWIEGMKRAPDSAKMKSLEQLSIDESTFDLDEAELFYTRGPLVAMMLDIEIRNKSNNKKSLDDVMLALNDDAKHGKTFSENDLIHKVEKYSGIDLTDFYNRYIHGTDSLPLDRYLAMMGLSLPSSGAQNEETQIAMVSDSMIFFQSLDPAGPLAKSGVQKGDQLVAINKTKITRDNEAVLLSMDSLTGSTLTVSRAGSQLDILVKYSEKKKSSEGSMDVDMDAPPLATEIRKGITGK